jgi:membrane protease YdiL (CAAX protease family)
MEAVIDLQSPEPLTMPGHKPRRQWGLWDAVICLIGAQILGLIVGLILFATSAPIGVLVIVGSAAPWLLLAGWPLYATSRWGNGPRIDLHLRLSWSDVRWGVLAGIVGLFMAAIVAVITTLFVGEFTSLAAEAAEELVDSASFASLFIFAVMLMVGAPIAEELAFRGLLFGALQRRGVGAAWTIIITAVIFAGFHFEPTRFFVLLAPGLVFGFVRWKTGSLGAAMVAHGVNNAPAAVFLLIGMPEVTP